MMALKTITHVALPLIIFPSIFLIGCKYMYIDHFSAGLDKTINALCYPPSPLPPSSLNLTLPPSQSYVRPYTYIPQVDFNEIGPCGVVAFFHLLLDAPTTAGIGGAPQEFLTYLLGTGLPCVLVTLVEAYRYKGKQHWLVTWPTFWLLMTQIATVGMTFPIYWSLLILSRGTAGSRTSEKPIASFITRGEAQGLALGLLVGAILPSAAMVVMSDPFITWLWQVYPVFVALVRSLFTKFVAPTRTRMSSPKSTTSRSNNKNKNVSETGKDDHESRTIMRTIYLSTFLLSSLMHIRTVWPLLRNKDTTTLVDLFMLRAAPSSETHPSLQALSFLKWDYALGYGTFLLAVLWSARNLKQITGIIFCYIVITPVLGIGAATMLVLSWRDL